MSTLESYLTTIADAIREKKGTTEPINASNFASEILSIQGGASLNLAYGTTPPTDTSKIWLQCAEPSSVEVQNYLGECAVSNVANWGTIENPVGNISQFFYEYYASCYIGGNKIAIVGYNHIRIFDLTSKSYIADYTISVGTNYYYQSVLYKDNTLYFLYSYDGKGSKFYKYDLNTQNLTQIYNYTGEVYKYIFFYSDDEIDYLGYVNAGWSYHGRYTISTGNCKGIKNTAGKYFSNINSQTIKVNNTVYNFYMYTTTDTNLYTWKYNILNGVFTKFTSFYEFMQNLGWSQYAYSNCIYDGEKYIYLIGGMGTYNGNSNTESDLIIKYDTINDTFELLDNKLIAAKKSQFVELINNRVYMFGGNDTRRNQLDYFDLQYPLQQNNAIITTNTINTDNALPLINTDKLKINSNIASAYKGNADNLAEKVNAYYYDGSKWVGINCDDYTEE